MDLDIRFVVEQPILQILFRVSASCFQPGYTINHIHDQMKAIKIIHHYHVERCGGSAFSFVTAYMQIVVICSSICEPMNKQRVAMKSKDDRFVFGEKCIKINIAQSVWMMCPIPFNCFEPLTTVKGTFDNLSILQGPY